MHLIISISFNLFSMPWNFKWEISIIMITYICVLMIFFLELINLFFCHPFHIPIIHPVVSHFIWLSLTSRIKSRILNTVCILLSAPYTYERPHDIFQSTKNKGPRPTHCKCILGMIFQIISNYTRYIWITYFKISQNNWDAFR